MLRFIGKRQDLENFFNWINKEFGEKTTIS
jgi:hypothetical protein